MNPEKDYLTPEETAKLDPFGVRKRKLQEEAASLAKQAPPPSPEVHSEQAEIENLEEILKTSQEAYDALGLKVDLAEDLAQGNILLCSAEQKEAAEKEGYTFPVIVDQRIERKDLIEKTSQYFKSKFNSEGIYLNEQAQKDLEKTEEAKSASRPEKPYLIYEKPDQEVKEAHPETMNQTFPASQAILDQRNQENPDLNLRGLTLPEYLLSQVVLDLSQAKHFESHTWTWLLAEQVQEQGKPVRCLIANWDVDEVRVNSDASSYSYGDWGARFAAVPQAHL